MNLEIFKYILTLSKQQTVITHKGAKILSAQMQNDKITMWALVDTNEDHCDRNIMIITTGEEINFELGEFISTIQDGEYVWHLFDNGKQINNALVAQ